MKEYSLVFPVLTLTLHVEQSRTLLAKAKGGLTAVTEMQQQDKPNTSIEATVFLTLKMDKIVKLKVQLLGMKYTI